MYDKIGCGDRLRKLRRIRNLTQEEVASDIGVSVDTIRKLEQGKRMPSVAVVDLLRGYYGTTADYIISGITGQNPKFDETMSNVPRDKRAKVEKIFEEIKELIE